MRRWKWLHNVDEPDAHPIYEVRNIPVRVRALLLGTNDEVAIDVLVGPSPTGVQGVDYQWVPLVRSGAPVLLTQTHRCFMEFIPGYYRVRLQNVVDPAGVRIVVHDDESATDNIGHVFVESGTQQCAYTNQV